MDLTSTYPGSACMNLGQCWVSSGDALHIPNLLVFVKFLWKHMNLEKMTKSYTSQIFNKKKFSSLQITLEKLKHKISISPCYIGLSTDFFC